MWFQRVFRGGGPTQLGQIASHPDPHRLGAYQDFLGIVPPYTRDWGQYQTFWNGNQYPGMTFGASQQVYPYAAIRHDVPGTASFAQLRGGAINQQVGSVSIGRLLDKMRAAWASQQS